MDPKQVFRDDSFDSSFIAGDDESSGDFNDHLNALKRNLDNFRGASRGKSSDKSKSLISGKKCKDGDFGTAQLSLYASEEDLKANSKRSFISQISSPSNQNQAGGSFFSACEEERKVSIV